MIFHRRRMNALKIQEQELKIKLAELKVLEHEYGFSPHLNVPVHIYRDGSRWVCMFESHEDPMKCVVAYGDSPRQACRNFDALWNGEAGFLIDDEEPEEEF